MQKTETPLKAIKRKCLEDCCAGDRKSYKNCKSPNCALYQFRFGTNPNRKPLTEEEKIERAKRFTKEN